MDRSLLIGGAIIACTALSFDWITLREQKDVGHAQVALAILGVLIAVLGKCRIVAHTTRFLRDSHIGFFHTAQTVAFIVVSLIWLPVPYIWISLILLVIIYQATIALIRQGRNPKPCLAALGMCISVLTAEGAALLYNQYRHFRTPFEVQSRNSGDHRRYDPKFGWRNTEGIISARKYRKRLFGQNEVIYDAKYTIDANGFRVTPTGSLDSDGRRSVAFFGGSFTFGTGLEDSETLPYYFAETASDVQVKNFGFGGWGPHQMLLILQDRRLDTWLSTGAELVVYSCIPSHVFRAAGVAPFHREGPRYAVESGTVVLKGAHKDIALLDPRDELSIRGCFERALSRSQVWHIFEYPEGPEFRRYGREDYRDNEIELFLAIVSESKRIAQQRIGTKKFLVIYWDVSQTRARAAVDARIISGLRNMNIEVIRVTEAIPDYIVNIENYILHEMDVHPNARANQLIADHIANHVNFVR